MVVLAQVVLNIEEEHIDRKNPKYAIIKYTHRKNNPMQVVRYHHTDYYNVKENKWERCHEDVSSTNFNVVKDGFDIFEEATAVMEKYKNKR